MQHNMVFTEIIILAKKNSSKHSTLVHADTGY